MPSTREWETARRGCVESCDRCLLLVDQIPAALYRGDDSAVQAIGPHVRHIIDHFTLFVRGIDAGEIDYDARDRDGIVERDPDVAAEALREVREQLLGLAPELGDREVVIRQASARNSEALCYRSTGARELVFLSSHTIHHLALIACLCEQLDMTLPESFNLAFSTEAHRQVAAG